MTLVEYFIFPSKIVNDNYILTNKPPIKFQLNTNFQTNFYSPFLIDSNLIKSNSIILDKEMGICS
jgi:hypothetical protein